MKVTGTPSDTAGFTLTPEQGNEIREYIVQQIDTSFRAYIRGKTGLHESNVSAILAGKRVCSIPMLKRLLSGTRIEITECTLSFTLENLSGGIVETADSMSLEEMLSLQETTDGVPLDNPLSHTPSLPLEKPQGRLKTLLGSRSWENQDESSDSSPNDSDSQST